MRRAPRMRVRMSICSVSLVRRRTLLRPPHRTRTVQHHAGLRRFAPPPDRGRSGGELLGAAGAAQLRAHVPELGEVRVVERLPQEADAGAAAGAALEADDPLDRHHVPEAPEAEALLGVDELLAHLELVPVAV